MDIMKYSPQNFERTLADWALKHSLFEDHMSFILGPRQVGKTTMVQKFLVSKNGNGLETYFNWDDVRIKKLIHENPYFFEKFQTPGRKLEIVFDEIHKMRTWKKYLKGAHDAFKSQFRFIITGSGRLDLFQRGGDSLAGRYDPYFLYPLTPAELEGLSPTDALNIEVLLQSKELHESIIESWEKLSGFPEPFFTGSEKKAQRWWEQYKIRVTEEDVRDLTRLESIDLIRNLLHILPSKLGSPLSLNALREHLDCSHATVARYVRTLCQLFFIFEVPPFSRKIARSVKKEKKIYFYNHLVTADVGPKLENMIALMLAKWCSSARERALGHYELFYLRDQDRREIDFLITLNNWPQLLIESKNSDLNFSSAARYYHTKLKVPIVQVVRQKSVAIKRKEGIVISLHRLARHTG